MDADGVKNTASAALPSEPAPVAAPGGGVLLPTRRRWFQVSLRTILAGTTLAGLLFAGVRSWISRAERQQAAVTVIRKMGGEVYYFKRSPTQLWLTGRFRNLPGDYVDSVYAIDWRDEERGHFELDFETGLPRDPPTFAHSWQGTPYTNDANLERLQSLASVRVMDLSHKNISGAGLAHLRGFNQLWALDLTGTPIADEDLAQLPFLPRMKNLCLTETRTTGKGISYLGQQRGLRLLWLNGTTFDDDDVTQLHVLSELELLDLHDTRVTDRGLAQFPPLIQLRTLYLPAESVTTAGVEELRRRLSGCHVALIEKKTYRWTQGIRRHSP